MTWLEKLEALEKAATPAPWHGCTAGVVRDEHDHDIAELTWKWDWEPNDGKRSREAIEIDEAIIFSLRNAAPRLLAIARAAERLAAALDIGRGYKGERDALRAALAGDGR